MRRPVLNAFLACLLLTLACAPLAAQTPPMTATAAQPSFKALDGNGNGRLSLEEVMVYAKGQGGQVAPFRAAEVDHDGDGILSVEEQQKAGLTGFAQFGGVDLKELDVNGDGYITREEIDAYFARRHREAYAKADLDKSGDLSPKEFVLYRF